MICCAIPAPRTDHGARARRKGVYGPLYRAGEERGAVERRAGGDRRARGARSRRCSTSPPPHLPSPVRVRLSLYYEVDSVGECDTRGACLRALHPPGG